jgi:glutathione S-transferase
MGYLDVALMPFVRQFAFVDKAWFDACEHQHLVDWLNRMLALPLFTSIMTKYEQWQEGDSPTLCWEPSMH